MNSYQGKTIWIIGASSGIGLALAKELAAQGATLILSARREEALHALQQEMGEQHLVLPMDIADAANVAAATQTITQKLDAVMILAAIYEPVTVAEITPQTAQEIVTTNLLGTFYVLHDVLHKLREQRHGQLVLCGSVAGYCGLPGGQPYSATKAAIINLAESLAIEEKPYGIDVRLLSPGFVKTPMTAKNSFPMPMMVNPEFAAKAIAQGLLTRHFEIHFPKRLTLLMKLLRIIPYFLYFPLMARVRR